MRCAYLFALCALVAACDSAPLDTPTPTPTPPPVTGSPEGSCAEGAWCWVRGRPMTVGDDRTFGTVYAIGPEGAFLRWDDDAASWVAAPVPTSHTLSSAWVGGADEAWVSDSVGGGWQFDGTRWSAADADAPIQRVVGAPDRTVWAEAGASEGAHGASEGGRLLRREGQAWVEAVPPYAWCLGGAYLVLGRDEVWSAGLTCDASGGVDALEVRRFDGTSWQLVGERIPRQGWYPHFEQLGDRVRVSASGLFEWDGSAWQPVTRPPPPQRLGAGEQALSDGIDYVTVPRSLGCDGAFRLDASRVWCFGEGQIYSAHEDPEVWRATLADRFAETQRDEQWGSMPSALWAGGDTRRAWGLDAGSAYRVDDDGRLWMRSGLRWVLTVEGGVRDLDGAPGDGVWLATDTGLMQHTRAGAVLHEIPSMFGSAPVTRVRALGQGAALVMIEDAVLLFDGSWSRLYAAPDRWALQDVAGSSLDQLWLVRAETGRSNTIAIERYDGQRWSVVDVPNASAFGTFGVREGQTWLLSDGIVTRLDPPDPNAPPISPPRRAFIGSLWVGPDALWLTTSHQAVRFVLP